MGKNHPPNLAGAAFKRLNFRAGARSAPPLLTGEPVKIASLPRRLWDLIPSGGALPEAVWRARFRFLVGLTWFHAVIIALIGPVLGYRWEFTPHAFVDDGTALHTVAEGSIVAIFALLATWRRAGRTVQATAVGFGLMSASAILVHLSGGYIELHFHFFVMLAFLALCQDWIPYLLAVAFVASTTASSASCGRRPSTTIRPRITRRGRGPASTRHSSCAPASAAWSRGDSTNGRSRRRR